MTALTAALALLPLVLAGNRPGHEIEYPMALVILGGLLSSTLMNLFILPSLYPGFRSASTSIRLRAKRSWENAFPASTGGGRETFSRRCILQEGLVFWGPKNAATRCGLPGEVAGTLSGNFHAFRSTSARRSAYRFAKAAKEKP